MFITLEGPEGSGKTSQMSPLADYLHQMGREVLLTREPGGTPISDQIRDVLMNLKNTSMNPRTEILLFLAARAQLISQVIRPALEKGVVVICDRYADSTLAYQGYGHGTDLDTLHRLLDFATGGLKPDVTFLLDVDIESGMQRKQTGKSEWNRMDAYNIAFHHRVREGYHKLAEAEPQRWVVLDANQPIDDVQAQLRREISRRLALTPSVKTSD